MGKFYENIPASLIPWIKAQKLFWVATAPLAEDGHVNVSPKGFERSLRVVLDSDDKETGGSQKTEEDTDSNKLTSRAVWYEDLTGSGVETISHVQENGRITIMFAAFEGPPMIVRLFGTAKVFEFGSPEYNELLPEDQRQPGSRAIIWIDIHKVGSSCGFAVPFFAYKGPRNKLHKLSCTFEQQEYDQRHPSADASARALAATPPPASDGDVELPQNGLKDYWRTANTKSLDGLPGLQDAFVADISLSDWSVKGKVYQSPDDESVTLVKESGRPHVRRRESSDATLKFGAALGFCCVVGKYVCPGLVSWDKAGIVAYGLLMVKLFMDRVQSTV